MLKKLIANIESVLVILVSVLLFVLNGFGFDSIFGIPINTTTLLTFILAILSMILYKLMEVKTTDINDALKVTNTKFDDLLLLTKGNISTVNPNKEPQIWNNFNGTFYAINAPWKLEENIEIGYDKIVKEYILDYEKDNLNKLVYVFFKTSDYPKAMDRFANFIKLVCKKSTIVKNKIKVLVVDNEAPKFSLFFGYKSNFGHSKEANEVKENNENTLHSYSVIYMNDKPFINKNGSPNWAFVSTEKAFNDVIESYIHQIVNDADDLLSIDEFIEWHDNHK